MRSLTFQRKFGNRLEVKFSVLTDMKQISGFQCVLICLLAD